MTDTIGTALNGEEIVERLREWADTCSQEAATFIEELIKERDEAISERDLFMLVYSDISILVGRQGTEDHPLIEDVRGTLHSSAADARRVAFEEAAKIVRRELSADLGEEIAALILSSQPAPANESGECPVPSTLAATPHAEDALTRHSEGESPSRRGGPDASQPAPSPEGREPPKTETFGQFSFAATPEVRQMPGVEADAIRWVVTLAELGLENTRQERMNYNHYPGTKKIGLYDEEVEKFDLGRTAILSLFQSGVKK